MEAFKQLMHTGNNYTSQITTMKKIFSYLVLLFISCFTYAQTNSTWNGKKCVVVLTYDDALNVHLTNAIPVLDSAGLKGTFYISDYFGGLSAQIPEWKAAAAKGHELANHTIFHPCTGRRPGREFVKPDYDLNNYTIKRITDETKAMNTLLKAIDGKTKRTFAFPCSDRNVNDTPYINGLKNDLVAARAVRSEMPTIDKIDLYNLPAYPINGESGDQMIALVKKAMENNAMLIFLFHGVGGGHNINVSLAAHRQLLKFLKENKKDIWTAPMLDVAEYIKKYQSPVAGEKKKGLKDYYKNYFPVGVAVSPRSLKTDEANLIRQQFNSITPENAMKMGPIHPREDRYFWRDADSIVNFAQQYGLKTRGHTLCWHHQTPPWLFKDSTGKTVTKEILLNRLKEHITAVVTRYKGKIYAWDVVNEAISDRKDEYLRNSMWLQICGEEYIAKAFQWAHEADPAALLFYNDYDEINPVKREKMYRLVKSLKDAGVPIHGVGMQGHWAINEPSASQLDSTIRRFAQLGVKIQITELDISVYPKEHNARERKEEDANTAFTAEREQKQLEVYKMSFDIFRKYKNVISGVTFWNISDRDSWLDNFPVQNRKDYPLLFDKDLKPKKAYWEVVRF